MSLIRLRGGNDTEWLVDPVLGRREPGVVPGGGIKIGDGSTPWSGLDWSTGLPQDDYTDGGDTTATGTPQDGGNATNGYVVEDGGSATATGSYQNGGSASTTGIPVQGGDSVAAPLITASEFGGDATTIWAGTYQITRAYRVTDVSTTLDAFDHVLGVSTDSVTITLPPLADVGTGREYIIKQFGAGSITLTGSGTENIDDTEDVTMRHNDALTVMSLDTLWIIL